MHKKYFEKLLKLADEYKGRCSPNPSVAALIVHNDKIVSRGIHKGPGTKHAEVMAIEKLMNLNIPACEVILYSTLEPCCHVNKKTQACAEYIKNSGIKHVYYAFKDPNPYVNGAGAKALQNNNIECTFVYNEKIENFYKSYKYWHTTSRPYITLKIAMTLNNIAANANNTRLLISSDKTNEFTHIKRKSADAILSTARTIMRDNPLLNARTRQGITYAKRLYILDRDLNISINSNIFVFNSPIYIFHDEIVAKDKIDAFKTIKHAHGAIELIPLTVKKNRQFELKAIIEHIGKDGIHDLWIEAGPKLFQNILKSKLANKIFIYISPIMLKNGIKALPNIYNFAIDEKSLMEINWHILEKDAILEITLH